VAAVSHELARHAVGWPADERAFDAARAFLHETRDKRTVIACDADVDGLTSAVIVERAVNAIGGLSYVLPTRRGEHVHHPVMRGGVLALRPDRLVVLDIGSRPQPILPGLPTLLIDHHYASAGLPADATVLNGYDRQPVATTSVLAFIVGRAFPPVERSAWLAALGAVADLGTAAPFRAVLGLSGGGAKWNQAVALLNAARRAPVPDPSVALNAIRGAASVDDVASGQLPETATLQRFQAEVRAEIDRCRRVPPAIARNVAMIRVSSGAQVHPVVATRWLRRLAPRIVMAANDGYLPGRTNFAVRSQSDIDLVTWLRRLPFTPSPDAEYAHGHPRATGGSLSTSDFGAFISRLVSQLNAIECRVVNSQR
jgi:hypothetical protein